MCLGIPSSLWRARKGECICVEMEMLLREPRVLEDTRRLANSILDAPCRLEIMSYRLFCLPLFLSSVTKCHMVVRVNRENLCAIGWSYAWNSIISGKAPGEGDDKSGGSDGREP